MTRLGGVIILLTVTVIGFINIIVRLYKTNKDLNTIIEYKNKLVDFLNTTNNYSFSSGIFDYLNTNSYEIQSILGEFGILDSLIDPIRGVQYRNYELIINGVNDLLMYSNSGIYSSVKESGLMMDSSIGKYIGYSNLQYEKLVKSLKNPFVWIREGIRLIIEFPIFFLYWTGLIKYSRYSKIKENIIVRLIKSFIGTLGFIGTVMTIVTGYESFINIIKQFIK